MDRLWRVLYAVTGIKAGLSMYRVRVGLSELGWSQHVPREVESVHLVQPLRPVVHRVCGAHHAPAPAVRAI